MTRVKSKFVAAVEINGKSVSFFTPPHDEPDFVWVDVEELTKAFLSRPAARRMVKHAQNFDRKNRAAETAAHNDKIVTIISHPMAQGLCSAIDAINGNEVNREEGMDGPAFREYCTAAAKVGSDRESISFEWIIAAYKNQGGPNLRGFKDQEDT